MKSRKTAAHGVPGGRSLCVRGMLGLVVLAGICRPRAAEAQLSAQPVILEMRSSPGAVATSSFTLRNEGGDPMRLQLYAVDFDQPRAGGHTFSELGTHPRSCADRLQFYPESMTLGPGETGAVELRMAPGERTCWSIVFAQTAARGSRGIRIAQRIGVKVYGVNAAAAPAGEVAAVRVARAAEGGPGYVAEVEFENTGEGPLRPEGEIELRTVGGEVVGVLDVPAFSVLPGRIRRASVPVELDLTPGEYLAIPILDFGGDYLAGGQARFSVEPQ